MSEIWRFSGETARAMDAAELTRVPAETARALTHPERVIIDTTPLLPCGCRQGMCDGHPLPPVLCGFSIAGRCTCPPYVYCRYRHRAAQPVIEVPALGMPTRFIEAAAEYRAAPAGSASLQQRFLTAAELADVLRPVTYKHGEPVTRPQLTVDDGVRQHLVNGRPATDPAVTAVSETVLCPCGCGLPAGTSGRPENAPASAPGIPLWDEEKHKALAEHGEPLTLAGDRLPSYDAVPPGCCTSCHLPVTAERAGGMCWYCERLNDLRTAWATEAVTPAIRVPDEPAERRTACEHGRAEQCPSCWPPRRPRQRWPAAVILAQAVTLIIAGIWLAPVLWLLAVPLAWAGINGIRERRRS